LHSKGHGRRGVIGKGHTTVSRERRVHARGRPYERDRRGLPGANSGRKKYRISVGAYFGKKDLRKSLQGKETLR